MVESETQVSAGGVTFRRHAGRVEVAIISVGPERHWQLPKGLVEPGEDPVDAALREVREETGLETELLTSLTQIDYWYQAVHSGRRMRHHKFVYFYLLRYLAGDVQDHDQEVNEAVWVEIGQALDLMTFPNERQVVQQAQEEIARLP